MAPWRVLVAWWAGLLVLVQLVSPYLSMAEAQSLPAAEVAALWSVYSCLHEAAPPGSPIDSEAEGEAEAEAEAEGEAEGGFFSTWNFNNDPCSFEGVICDVVDGQERIAALNLGIASGSSAGLRGRLHPALGSFSALVQLTLAPGKVSGSIPSTIAELTRLQNLGLSHNLLTGCIPAGISALSQLITLDLAFNRLSGSIPGELAALPNLVTLRLAHNRLSGALPASFAASPCLDHLDAGRNFLTGSLPYLPPSLTHLNLARNELSGGLENLQPLSCLSFLDLSHNQLSGSFPVQILSSPALTYLSVQRNSLSGPLSPLQLVVVPTLDLSFNQLCGPISPFFAFARSLYLNNNRFSGGVPQEFVDQLLSSSMQTLFLQHNFLTNFPLSSLSSLPLTASVCIQYNCLQQLPATVDSSPCPHSRGKLRPTRPSIECKNS